MVSVLTYKIARTQELGLAFDGYSLVLKDGYFKYLHIKRRVSTKAAALFILLYHISKLKDTNIVNRSDEHTLVSIMKMSGDLFEKHFYTNTIDECCSYAIFIAWIMCLGTRDVA